MPRPHSCPGRTATKAWPPSALAFTLIELLTVIAVIAVLASLTFGVIRGVRQHAAAQQTRAELAALAQSMENQFRRSGDYPHTGERMAGLRDGWGRPYHYYYFADDGRLGYVLYSAGPDGLHQPPASLTDRYPTDPRNLDNLYAGN